MRWVHRQLWYQQYALDVFAALTSKGQVKNNQMFGKIIKTLTDLYRRKRLMHDIIAVIIRQSFWWLKSQYLDSDILESPESIMNLYLYITYCALNDQSMQSSLHYSDSEVGISIDYSRNSINRVNESQMQCNWKQWGKIVIHKAFNFVWKSAHIFRCNWDQTL